jgi:D-sedoheptulose 7-phosphate isomerase
MDDLNRARDPNADRVSFVRSTLDAGAGALQDTARALAETVDALAREWVDCLRAGGKVMLMGNGGSQADAQHLAGELVNRFRRDRRGLPALALATSSPVLTSVANDDDYARVFAREVEAYGTATDLVVGFSTSGRSPNVVQGLLKARELGLGTQAFTGQTGGPVADAADTALRAPSLDTPIIQQVHMAVGHVICDLVEAALFPEGE